MPTKEEIKVKKEPEGGYVSSLDLKNVRLGQFGVSDVIVECSAFSKEFDKSVMTSHLVSIVSKFKMMNIFFSSDIHYTQRKMYEIW